MAFFGLKLIPSEALLPTVPPHELHDLMEGRGDCLHTMEPGSTEDDIVGTRGIDHYKFNIHHSGTGAHGKGNQAEQPNWSTCEAHKWC